MSKFILALFFLVSASAFADEWTTDDTKLELIYFGLHEIDRRQTLSFIDYKYELNPFLGETPNAEQVNTYFVITALAHAGIAYALPAEWRKPFQYVSISLEFANVLRNYYFVGARIPF